MSEAMIFLRYGDEDYELYAAGTEKEMRAEFTKLVIEERNDDSNSCYLVKVLASADLLIGFH